ncbi:MAG: hypothetical protein K2X77_18505 [Candidatus Obscuribacterales bacterium]|nr:hypothetical protein [Candidatus Obscuribacterales bacterium]
MRHLSELSPDKSQKTVEKVYEWVNKFENELSEMMYYGLDDKDLPPGASYKSTLFSKLDYTELFLGVLEDKLLAAFWLIPTETPGRQWQMMPWAVSSHWNFEEFVEGVSRYCFDKLGLVKIQVKLGMDLEECEKPFEMQCFLRAGFEVSGCLKADRLRGGALADMLLLERINPALLPVPKESPNVTSRNNYAEAAERIGRRLIESAKQLYIYGLVWKQRLSKWLAPKCRKDDKPRRL